MTKIISVFPCINKEKFSKNECYFDATQILEAEATKMMTTKNKNIFYRNCTSAITNLYRTGFYDIIFITEEKRILEKLALADIPVVQILPNINSLDKYKNQVIIKHGEEIWEHDIKGRVEGLPDLVDFANSTGNPIHFVNPYEGISMLLLKILRN